MLELTFIFNYSSLYFYYLIYIRFMYNTFLMHLRYILENEYYMDNIGIIVKYILKS